MEPFPHVKDVLQDGRSEALQLFRARAQTQKLHVPGGLQLTVSRAKLGYPLYHPPADFLNTGPTLRLMKPSYNSYHDPHLHSYYYQRPMQDKLRKGKCITKDNEVICSLKDYNIYEEYLRTLKLLADRKYDETQRAKMKAFVEFQEKGLLPCDVSLADVTEVLLEEGAENRRQLVRAESMRQENRHRGTEAENGNRQTETDFYTELYLMAWNADDRSRLMMYEREFRHEQNKKTYLREVQKERDRKKQAALAQKCAVQHKELKEILKIAKRSAKGRVNINKQQGDRVQLVPPGGNRCRILQSDQLRVSQQKTTSVEHQKQGTLEHEGDQESNTNENNCDDSLCLEDSGENPEIVDEMLLGESRVDPQCFLPRRRPFRLPPLRTCRRPGQMDQNCAIL